MIGVQVESCAAYVTSLERGEPVEVGGGPTIADGIAIKRPGGLVLPLVQAWVDELVVVAENDVAEAMVLLLERAKLVVEGAGAVGVAALRRRRDRAGRARARRSSSSRAATSTPACSRPSRCGTRPRRAGGCASSRASRTGPAGSRAC